MSRKEYQHTMIYHPSVQHKRTFAKEVLGRFESFSAMAKAIVEDPKSVFNDKILKK